MIGARLLYWVDRLLSRECWRLVPRDGLSGFDQSLAGMRSKELHSYGDAKMFFSDDRYSHIEYQHRSFFRQRRVIPEVRLTTVDQTLNAIERLAGDE